MAVVHAKLNRPPFQSLLSQQSQELFFHLKRLGALSVPMMRFLAAELVLALEYLHERGVIYRDLKVSKLRVVPTDQSYQHGPEPPPLSTISRNH